MTEGRISRIVLRSIFPSRGLNALRLTFSESPTSGGNASRATWSTTSATVWIADTLRPRSGTREPMSHMMPSVVSCASAVDICNAVSVALAPTSSPETIWVFSTSVWLAANRKAEPALTAWSAKITARTRSTPATAKLTCPRLILRYQGRCLRPSLATAGRTH